MPLRNEFSRASIWEAQRFLRPLPFLPALGCVPQRRLRSACVWGPPLRRTELASLRRRCDRRDLRSYARDSGRCNLRELKDRIAEAAKAVSAPLTFCAAAYRRDRLRRCGRGVLRTRVAHQVLRSRSPQRAVTASGRLVLSAQERRSICRRCRPPLRNVWANSHRPNSPPRIGAEPNSRWLVQHRALR